MRNHSKQSQKICSLESRVDVNFPVTTQLPHALSAMPHGGAGIATEENIPRRLRGDGDRRDIFAMVKANMADTQLIQPPLLCWPHSLLGSTEAFFNGVNETDEIIQQSLEQSRVDELVQLGDQIQKDFPHLGRSVQYYKSLVNPNRPRKPFAKLQFIDAGPQASSRVGDVRLGQRPMPPRPHRLEVVYHHGRG